MKRLAADRGDSATWCTFPRSAAALITATERQVWHSTLKACLDNSMYATACVRGRCLPNRGATNGSALVCHVRLATTQLATSYNQATDSC